MHEDELGKRLMEFLGIDCCKEHGQHVFVAPKDDKGIPIFPVPSETRCFCGEMTLREAEQDDRESEREQDQIRGHDARWGSRHLSN